MPVATYYFDASVAGPTDPGAAWTNPANAFDGNTGTAATVTLENNSLTAQGTTAPTTGATISLVRARAYNSVNAAGFLQTNILDGAINIGIISISSGSSGYTSYINLTVPSGGWTWSKIKNLNVESHVFFGSSNHDLALIEIEVTSNDSPNLAWLKG